MEELKAILKTLIKTYSVSFEFEVLGEYIFIEISFGKGRWEGGGVVENFILLLWLFQNKDADPRTQVPRSEENKKQVSAFQEGFTFQNSLDNI